jgi:hypothetical protein
MQISFLLLKKSDSEKTFSDTGIVEVLKLSLCLNHQNELVFD